MRRKERDHIFERFTERARQVCVIAQKEARNLRHNHIGTEHILLGLLIEEEGLAARVLESFDIDVEIVRVHVKAIDGTGLETIQGQIPFTAPAKKVFELALREALSLGHNYIGTEHILLGLVREEEDVAARILLDLGVSAEEIRQTIVRMLAGPRKTALSTSSVDEQSWWWQSPSREDLADVHHALRLVAKYPGLSPNEVARYKELADGIWDGYFVRRAAGS